MFNTHQNIIEVLPTELWRDIFDYFNFKELWYSFRGLNTRIDLIIDQILLHFDFHRKGTYDYALNHILSSINVNNVRSIKLRKANETKLFFSIYPLNSLIQLRILSLVTMYSLNDKSCQFWYQLSSLKYLQSLTIMFSGYCNHENIMEEKQFIIRSIFNKEFCPLLKVFIISTAGTDRGKPSIPSLMLTTKPTKIKYLSIDWLTFHDLIKLLPALQNVKSIYMKYELALDKDQQQEIPTITRLLMPNCIRLNLSLSKDITFEHIVYILKHTQILEDLFLWSPYYFGNAKEWEMLLSAQCSKLVKFELDCMCRTAGGNMHQTSNGFQQEGLSSFWTERNTTIIYSGHLSDGISSHFTVRFNTKKVCISCRD